MSFINCGNLSDLELAKPLIKRVLLLADKKHQAGVIKDHINAFDEYSVHNISIRNPIEDVAPSAFHFLFFDTVIVHYSIFVLSEYFFSREWEYWLMHFPGQKIQIIQDEYRYVRAMSKKMDVLGISIVLSSLSPTNVGKVYSTEIGNDVMVYSTLPGYVSSKMRKTKHKPIEKRTVDVAYRGRELPIILGSFSKKKAKIGRQISAVAMGMALTIDIETSEEKRIYGKRWDNFLANTKATLGVEGGASLFDFDGELTDLYYANAASEHPKEREDRRIQALISKLDGNITHSTITPRIFEAVAQKTLLILYPGFYRGVLKKDVHFLELREDGSNAIEVLNKIKDKDLVRRITHRAFEDVILDDRLSFRRYISKIDSLISEGILRHSLVKTVLKYLLPSLFLSFKSFCFAQLLFPKKNSLILNSDSFWKR